MRLKVLGSIFLEVCGGSEDPTTTVMKSRRIATECLEKQESVQMLIATHEVLQVVHVPNFLRTACQIVRIWFSI